MVNRCAVDDRCPESGIWLEQSALINFVAATAESSSKNLIRFW